MRPRLRPPLWVELLIALLGAAAIAWLAAHAPPHPPRGAVDLPDVQGAFLGFLIAVVEIIWTGIQILGEVTLEILAWSVHWLWVFAIAIRNGLIELGSGALAVFQKSWSFLRTFYDHILKPAWGKFWKFIDWAKRSLEDLFRPIFRVLRAVRAELLKLYAKYVRPVLDTIDLARKILHVASKLGLDVAAKLEARLGDLETWISDRFQEILGRVNNAIDIVDRVVTGDGLFQRLALVRSLARDFSYIGQEWAKLFKKPATEEELLKARKAKYFTEDSKVYGDELVKAYKGEDNAYAGIIGELAPEWTRAAGLRET